MEKKEKIKIFKDELGFIQDENIRFFAEIAIGKAPDYFFTIPASSSGKYHPSYALGDGGLVRHTKAAIKIAKELFNLEQYTNIFDAKVQDLILVSILLHDTYKSGIKQQTYTVSAHPLLPAMMIMKDHDLKNMLPIKDIKFICNNIKSHMGQWNKITNVKFLPKPNSEAEKFVHLCDYLASRKFLEVLF